MPCKTTPNLIFWTVAQTGKVTPLVSGPPGCGKSRTIEAFARAMSRQCYTLIGSLREPADVGGYPYPVHGEQPYMAVMPPKWAQDCQNGQWVLFLDELTTCPPAVQAALLGVIAENRVGDAVLPDTVWKLAACNPPDCAANGSELEPPLANRLCHLTWETDTEAWQRGMGNALGFPQPSFVPLPPDWEKCVGRNTGLVGAFHKHKPGLLEAYPKDRAKTSGPWPSIRSWTNAAICAAALEAIDAEPLLRYRAVAGCVGEEAALEFQTWEQSLDLPDPEVWLSQAETARAGGDCPCAGHSAALRSSHGGAGRAGGPGEEPQPWSQRQAHGRALAGGGGLLCRSGEVLAGAGDCRGRPALLRRAPCLGAGQGPDGFQQHGVAGPQEHHGGVEEHQP